MNSLFDKEYIKKLQEEEMQSRKKELEELREKCKQLNNNIAE